MSVDPPPPPPVGSTPLPPPPTPGLMAPPGYVGYTASPMSAVALKRTAGIERAAVAIVIVGAVLALAALLAGRAAVGDADAFLAGETDESDFIEAVSPFLLVSFLQGVAVLAGAVLVIIWLYRVASNHRALHRDTTWGPGWAIGGWFLPPLVYVIPTLMLREQWKASDPDVPIGGDWRSGRASPLIVVWFVLYSVVPFVLLAFESGDVMAGLAASENEMAEQITGDQTATVVGAVVAVAAAAAFVLVARGLGRRHRRLTGEDRT